MAGPNSLTPLLLHLIPLVFAVPLLLGILGFRALNNDSVIKAVLKLAGYTYGPLLGLFGFGLLCRARVRDRLVPLPCLAAPLVCFILESGSERWFGGYRFGFELLMLNGCLTAFGLFLLVDWTGPGVSRA